MIFHEPAPDEMNTNKLIGKFNLGQLIISPLHCGLEKLQMTPGLMIQLTQRHMLTMLNRPGWYPLTVCLLETHKCLLTFFSVQNLFMLWASEVQSVWKFTEAAGPLRRRGHWQTNYLPRSSHHVHLPGLDL